VSTAPAGAPLERPADRWVARLVSAGLHLAVLALFGSAMLVPRPPATVIFSVETVPGVMPRGEGSGAEGTASAISNKPANRNPLAGGLRLSVADAPLPEPQAKPKSRPAKPSRQAAQAPSLSEVSKRYETLKIGVQPRSPGSADELSEGGMGNAHQAGTEDGALGLDGAIAGRGYRTGDYSYGKPLPEESEVQVLVTVGPKGEVLEAQIKKTSGYPELDQHALSKAREIVFDALPTDVPQENKTGTVSFRFEYTGKAK
jgi:TonB family protein